MRTSSYVIYVDLPNDADSMLLVHGYTGAYDKVSRRIATYIRAREVRKAPKPLWGAWAPEPELTGYSFEPSEEDMEHLRQRGYLTEMTIEAEESLFRTFVEKFHQCTVRQMPTYIFMPTYDCNLRCPYCFQDHMRTQPQFSHLLKGMTIETVDRIFRGMNDIERLHGVDTASTQHRTIGFFGGEPLMSENRHVVKAIIERALEKGTASFWAITNGTELESYADLLKPDVIGSLQITIDGLPEEHDRRRIYANGDGSFGQIRRNITMALSNGVAVTIRLNIDKRNIADLPQLVELFHENGWPSHKRFSVYAAPVRPENDNVDRTLTMTSWDLDIALSTLREQIKSTAIIRRPDDGVKDRTRRLFDTPDSIGPGLKESFCSAHTKMYIFDAFADIYACWERTGDSKIRIGSIMPDGVLQLDQAVVDVWRTRTVVSNPICAQCRYALYCGGGCAVWAMAKTGQYHMNYCDGFASRFRAVVGEAYLEHLVGQALDNQAEAICDL